MILEAGTLQEQLSEASRELATIASRLSSKQDEFQQRKTTCSQSEFCSMHNGILQLEAIQAEKREVHSRLESEYANQLWQERQEYERSENLKRRTALLAESNGHQQEIEQLKAKISTAQDRITDLVLDLNRRIWPQLNLIRE